MKRLTDKTAVMITAIAGVGTGVCAYGGMLIFVAGVNSKADTALAQSLSTEARVDRTGEAIRALRTEVAEVRDVAVESRGMLQVLVDGGAPKRKAK
jgi:hypothetical protein